MGVTKHLTTELGEIEREIERIEDKHWPDEVPKLALRAGTN